jgi:hypothetical protein
MKHASLLIVLCALFSLSAVAQSAAPVEKKTQRITITTKKIDDKGQTITETYIAEGENPGEILKEMTINADVIQEVRVEGDVKETEGERLFLYRSAGEKVVIEGTLNENADTDAEQEIVIIRNVGDEPKAEEWRKEMTWHHGGGQNKAYAYVNVVEQKSNCAALGVYIGRSEDVFGARISGIIEKGGAQDAGLTEGDVIKKIDEFEVTDYPSLYFALSHYRAGDEVVVRYDRDDQYHNVTVTLKDWAQLPGFEYKARTDCGEPETPAVPDTKRDEGDGLSDIHEFQALELADARIFPNPTEGEFSLSFTANPGPLFVSITDANGKVVFREQNDNTSGYYNRNIDIKDLPQGNYIISVTQDDKVFTQQISKL